MISLEEYRMFSKEYVQYRLGNVESLVRLAWRKAFKQPLPRKYINHKKVLDEHRFNRLIREKIESGNPFMAARFGANECNVLNKYLCKKFGMLEDYPKLNIDALCNNAGFFPRNTDMIDQYAELMLECCSELDYIALWNDAHENYIIRKYAPQATGTLLECLRPCYYEDTWTRALKGKKVCVVHPFAETILEQYSGRELIYPNGELPEFELRVVKAVQTIAGNVDSRFETWFDALEYMEREIASEPFDIAIIGCGAYGFPLAAYVKSIGKQAIHLGGTTQLMFGIKGARWDDDSPLGKKLYNSYWVYPSAHETPANIDSVEGGCYWK